MKGLFFERTNLIFKDTCIATTLIYPVCFLIQAAARTQPEGFSRTAHAHVTRSQSRKLAFQEITCLPFVVLPLASPTPSLSPLFLCRPHFLVREPDWTAGRALCWRAAGQPATSAPRAATQARDHSWPPGLEGDSGQGGNSEAHGNLPSSSSRLQAGRVQIRLTRSAGPPGETHGPRSFEGQLQAQRQAAFIYLISDKNHKRERGLGMWLRSRALT